MEVACSAAKVSSSPSCGVVGGGSVYGGLPVELGWPNWALAKWLGDVGLERAAAHMLGLYGHTNLLARLTHLAAHLHPPLPPRMHVLHGLLARAATQLEADSHAGVVVPNRSSIVVAAAIVGVSGGYELTSALNLQRLHTCWPTPLVASPSSPPPRLARPMRSALAAPAEPPLPTDATGEERVHSPRGRRRTRRRVESGTSEDEDASESEEEEDGEAAEARHREHAAYKANAGERRAKRHHFKRMGEVEQAACRPGGEVALAYEARALGWLGDDDDAPSPPPANVPTLDEWARAPLLAMAPAAPSPSPPKMAVLLIQKDWGEQILSGAKVLEVRRGRSKHVGSVIGVSFTATSTVQGHAAFVACHGPITATQWTALRPFHLVDSDVLPYGEHTYAYELRGAQRLQPPIAYKHGGSKTWDAAAVPFPVESWQRTALAACGYFVMTTPPSLQEALQAAAQKLNASLMDAIAPEWQPPVPSGATRRHKQLGRSSALRTQVLGACTALLQPVEADTPLYKPAWLLTEPGALKQVCHRDAASENTWSILFAVTQRRFHFSDVPQPLDLTAGEVLVFEAKRPHYGAALRECAPAPSVGLHVYAGSGIDPAHVNDELHPCA